MPAGWIHQTQDFVFWGCIYSDVHKTKDAQSQITPGKRHRNVGHEWYQSFGKLWDFSNPFPDCVQEDIRQLRDTKGADAAEVMQASYSHDLIDRTWDGLSDEERNYWQAFFAWLLYNPDVLESWAGVDVLRGRILRRIDGRDVWEDAPEIIQQYKRLKREVSRHYISRLREVLACYG